MNYGGTYRVICRHCGEPYNAGHICSADRSKWDTMRRQAHRCTCDTCYRAYLRGQPA